ncbi:hypothetical protein PM082_013277 [Marasmius tenuissimus]|nr:hypothetical protein PM082_013277 [Marasmius tenuissimus]
MSSNRLPPDFLTMSYYFPLEFFFPGFSIISSFNCTPTRSSIFFGPFFNRYALIPSSHTTHPAYHTLQHPLTACIYHPSLHPFYSDLPHTKKFPLPPPQIHKLCFTSILYPYPVSRIPFVVNAIIVVSPLHLTHLTAIAINPPSASCLLYVHAHIHIYHIKANHSKPIPIP